MTILIIAIVAVLAVYACRHAYREEQREAETRRLIRRLYGGGE